MIIYTSKFEKINIAASPFASGGEGAIYKVESAPSHMQNVCVKIYHAHVVNKQREERIKFMVANPPSQIRGEGFMLGWPMDYVTDDSGKFLGFIMPLAFPDSKELVNLTATTLSKKLDKEWQERYDRSLGKKALLSRLKLICNIAIPVHILHSTGKYVLKDFKPQNVLATADGRITICDMDSIQIAEGGNLLFPGTAATPDYMPPEFYSKGIGKKAGDIISESWDSFAIGVVFYQLLFGIHPYVVTPKEEQDDGANSISSNISSGLFPFGINGDMVKIRPKLHDKFMMLPQGLQDLFTRTFDEQEMDRPNAEEWGKFIHNIVTSTDEETNKPIADLETDKDNNINNSHAGNNKNIIWYVLIALVIVAIVLITATTNSNTEATPDEQMVELKSESAENLYRKALKDTLDVEDLIRSAEMGYAPAQTELGIRYYKGEGFDTDSLEALDWFYKASEQGDSEARDYITYIKGTYIVDEIEYKDVALDEEFISNWKIQYRDKCIEKIKGNCESYTNVDEMAGKDPCLVYLIINSKSLEDKRQEWFDLYSLMSDEQIYKLYDILYREKIKFLIIEMKYDLTQRRIKRIRNVLEERAEELLK